MLYEHSLQNGCERTWRRERSKRTDIVPGIKDTEDVETVLHSLLGEIVDGVVTTNHSALPLISKIDTTHG